MPGDHLGHKRDTRRCASEHDAAKLARLGTARRKCPVERIEGLGEPRAQRRLELVAGDPHLGRQTRQRNSDCGLTVGGQALLDKSALCTKASNGRMNRWVAAIELLDGTAKCLHHMPEHHLIEINATETFEILGGTDDLRARCRKGDDRCLERRAEAVHGNGVSDSDDTRIDELTCRRDGLADQLNIGESSARCNVAKQVDFVLAPVCRVRKRERGGRWINVGLRGNGTKQLRRQCIGVVWMTIEYERGLIAETAFEFVRAVVGLARNDCLRGHTKHE